MARSVLSAPQFQDEKSAFAYVEARLWPTGAVCPHCGVTGDQVKRLNGKTTRIGLHKCYACKGQFTVRQGTIFESSHLPLHLWLQVIHLMCASKKGISTRQIQRMLVCSMKTAWFLTHRIREAMTDGSVEPFGSGGGIVEADETFIGRRAGAKVRAGIGHKMKVLSVLDRTTGAKRSVVLDNMKPDTIAAIVKENVSPEAHLMTDEAGHYYRMGKDFAAHSEVNHGKGQYVSLADPTIHTNTIEGSFSVFKRGMRGI